MLGNHSAYNSALKNKWSNEICSHMVSLRHTWTKEECKNEALKYKHIEVNMRKRIIIHGILLEKIIGWMKFVHIWYYCTLVVVKMNVK